MFKLPKTVLSFGAGALALGGLILAAPRTAHAIAATLVQVTNTPADPVPNKDVDNPARHPYAANCTASGTGEISCSPTPLPAAGVETVIQNVSMFVSRLAGTGTPASTTFFFETGCPIYANYLPLVTQFDIPGNEGGWTANQAMTVYRDPSRGDVCVTNTTDLFTPVQINCTVTGYTVSLP
jgi:hypothetical protein